MWDGFVRAKDQQGEVLKDGYKGMRHAVQRSWPGVATGNREA